MKNRSIFIALAILVVIGGALAVTLNKQSDDAPESSAKVSNAETTLETTQAMKDEEAKFRTYVGDDYDRYYIANMIGHHTGAVDMAKVALTNAKHEELKTLANNIIDAQNKEITSMQGWQSAWGYPASSGPNMVDHSAMSMMEDMATMTEDLKKKTGDDFDKAFLQMMIVHHESAIAMSRPAPDNAKHQEVKDLAAAVIKDQTREVLQMRKWHQDWGYGTVPSASNPSSLDMGHDMSNM